jgi:hypothetical protein
MLNAKVSQNIAYLPRRKSKYVRVSVFVTGTAKSLAKSEVFMIINFTNRTY